MISERGSAERFGTRHAISIITSLIFVSVTAVRHLYAATSWQHTISLVARALSILCLVVDPLVRTGDDEALVGFAFHVAWLFAHSILCLVTCADAIHAFFECASTTETHTAAILIHAHVWLVTSTLIDSSIQKSYVAADFVTTLGMYLPSSPGNTLGIVWLQSWLHIFFAVSHCPFAKAHASIGISFIFSRLS
jgi:hypothetical protein